MGKSLPMPQGNLSFMIKIILPMTSN
ncbi:hypothetical protein MTR67_018550 [Solanum verrucosum]|uniref:Uncharacterized protein n=1 Tax=Solanum verrucosum TaxID=315347 RepID=A0AAF0TT50_SOLVR|nr:hypothetical protein MTR67_018550 [Solanum verrucosum]